jgi:hypothetical protein
LAEHPFHNLFGKGRKGICPLRQLSPPSNAEEVKPEVLWERR